MVSNMSSFMSLNSPLIVLLMYCREVSITLDLTIDAPISPLRAATVEYPPISIKYLQTLFSCLCILFTKDLQVGTTALPNRIDGRAISFHMALPTTTLSALFLTLPHLTSPYLTLPH